MKSKSSSSLEVGAARVPPRRPSRASATGREQRLQPGDQPVAGLVGRVDAAQRGLQPVQLPVSEPATSASPAVSSPSRYSTSAPGVG